MEVSHCFSKMLFLDNEPSELVAHFLCFHIHSNSDYAFRPDFECDFHTPELRLARGIQKNDLLSNYSPQRETTSCQHLLTQTWNPKLGDGPHVCLFGGAARIFTRRVARDFVERHAYDVEMEKILKPEQITSVL